MLGSWNTTLFMATPVKKASWARAVTHAGSPGAATCSAESERLVMASIASNGAEPVKSSAVLRTTGSEWVTI